MNWLHYEGIVCDNKKYNFEVSLAIKYGCVQCILTLNSHLQK
jgi:hypothetical protein